MSGGSFDYAYFRAEQFAEELKDKLQNEKHDWSEATVRKLKEIAELVGNASVLMKEAEWLYSGDTGEQTFLERIQKAELGDNND